MSGASEQAYIEIRKRLISGEYAPGSRLSESELSGICGVSRTPVREALRRLASEYFVRVEPNRGAFVIDWSREDIMDMFEMRALLEGWAARKAAERASVGDIDKMSAIARKISEIADEGGPAMRQKFLDFNRQFHDVIFETSGSPKLSEVMSRFVEQAVVVRTAEYYSSEDVHRSNAHHQELIAAIKGRNGMLAENIMRMHILAASNRYHDAYMPNDGVAAE